MFINLFIQTSVSNDFIKSCPATTWFSDSPIQLGKSQLLYLFKANENTEILVQIISYDNKSIII